MVRFNIMAQGHTAERPVVSRAASVRNPKLDKPCYRKTLAICAAAHLDRFGWTDSGDAG